MAEIPEISFFDYLEYVEDARKQYPDWRYGQALFNVLWELRPDLCQSARAADLDPFYADQFPGGKVIIREWLRHVREAW